MLNPLLSLEAIVKVLSHLQFKAIINEFENQIRDLVLTVAHRVLFQHVQEPSYSSSVVRQLGEFHWRLALEVVDVRHYEQRPFPFHDLYQRLDLLWILHDQLVEKSRRAWRCLLKLFIDLFDLILILYRRNNTSNETALTVRQERKAQGCEKLPAHLVNLDAPLGADVVHELPQGVGEASHRDQFELVVVNVSVSIAFTIPHDRADRLHLYEVNVSLALHIRVDEVL